MSQMHSDFNYEREAHPEGRFGSPGGSCQTKGSTGDKVRSRPEGWRCPMVSFDIQ